MESGRRRYRPSKRLAQYQPEDDQQQPHRTQAVTPQHVVSGPVAATGQRQTKALVEKSYLPAAMNNSRFESPVLHLISPVKHIQRTVIVCNDDDGRAAFVGNLAE